MSPLRDYSIILVIVLGFIFAGRGAMLWTETSSGGVTQNWITPASAIPAHAYMWTWGIDGDPKEEPDLWHFHVIFSANDTAEVLLLWNLNQSILFQRNSSRIDETFETALPRTNQPWRWDWLIRNPHGSALGVDNFTITHFSVRYSERQNGGTAIGTGLFLIVAAAIAFVYFSRRDSRPL